jgi:class 3 adenylate cyclase
MALPMLGLAWLLLRPEADLHWQHNATHFWLVAGVCLINVIIASRISEDTARRQDARMFLVSLAFQVSAAFIGLHALATPRVLLAGGNAGFTLASPVGLFLAATIVAVSSFELSVGFAGWVIRHQRLLRYSVTGIMVLWAFLALNELPPLDAPLEEELGSGPWVAMGGLAVGLYLLGAFRFYRIHARRPSAVSLALTTAFVLLAEAMVAVILAPAWQLSWWEWHILALAAFGYVWYAAFLQRGHQGQPAGLFDGVALEETVDRIRSEYHDALEEMVESMSSTDATARQATARRLGTSLGLTGVQAEVLGQAAEALAAERRHGELLAAMAEIGRRARVSQDEQSLAMAAGEVASRASGYRVTVSLDPEATAGNGGAALRLPIHVQDRQAGVLEVDNQGTSIPATDRTLLESMAGQVAVALENRRLYSELQALFSRYTSPEVAAALLGGAAQLELGGSVAEVTVLFADLKGFTSYSERVAHPQRVVELLNRYFSAAVPVVRGHGGMVDKFVGDAFMALFNTPVLQADHALRAARAALAVQAVVAGLGEDLSFRIGINTGPAVVGNIGSEDMRNFTAIGDAVNVASRLETMAEPGEIVVGPTTAALIRHVADLESLGGIEVRGRSEAVQAFRLRALRE